MNPPLVGAGFTHNIQNEVAYMALRLGGQIESVLYHESGEEIKAFFLPFHDPVAKEYMQRMSMHVPDEDENEEEDEKARLARLRRENRQTFIEMFDGLACRVEGIDGQNADGEWVPLTPENFPDWKSRLSDEWKFLWAVDYRIQTRLRPEQVKNSEGQSEQDMN